MKVVKGVYGVRSKDKDHGKGQSMSENNTGDFNKYEPNRPITASEAAELVGVSVKTIYNWIDGGKIPGYLHGYDNVVVDQDDIDPLLGYRRIVPRNVKEARKEMTDALAKSKEESES